MTNYSEKYNSLDDVSKESLNLRIQKRMCGKSHIADILINDSDLDDYLFYIQVWKFSPSSGKGWSTNGYAKQKSNGDWSINMNPKKSANNHIGRTAKYS